MLEFSLKEYQNTNPNTKIKVFIEYLYKKYGGSNDNDDFNNEYFYLFNVDDLIESLQYYIDKNNVTAQITASNYITYISEFFNMISNKYGIINDIFTDISLHNELMSKSKEIISRLKKSESKEVASDEQYETLNSGIENFINELNIDDIYDEIIDYKNGNKKHIKIYNRFISIIAIKLIMKYGIGNSVAISLEFKDLNMEEKTIDVNGFNLDVDEELIKFFKMYLPIREYILNLYSLEESKLFIKNNGDKYIRYYENRNPTPDYGTFFMIMDDIIHTRAAELFTSRRILEMLDKGIDISTVSRISNKSTNKCIELQMNSNNEEDIKRKLKIFLKGNELAEKKIKAKRKDYTNCPFCGREVKAVSSEWILVQFENEDTKHLVCRKCRGINERGSL